MFGKLILREFVCVKSGDGGGGSGGWWLVERRMTVEVFGGYLVSTWILSTTAAS